MKNKNENKKLFSLSDLGCAAALLCNGHEIKKLDRSDPNRVCFLFFESEAVRKDANAYLADNLEVRARSYYDALKALKSRLYR